MLTSFCNVLNFPPLASIPVMNSRTSRVEVEKQDSFMSLDFL